MSSPDAGDGGREVEVHAVLERPDALALVDHGLGVARRHVAGHQVAEAGVLPLEEVVALGLGDLVGRARVVGVARHPDAPVVAQRLAHQRELGLELVAGRDAGRVDLRVAGVGEQRAPPVGPPGGRGVGVLGVRRQEEDVPVAAGAQQHRVGRVGHHLAGDHVAHDDAARHPVLDDEVEHLGAGVQRDRAQRHLVHHLLVRAEQELLAGLAPGVEGARHLGAAEAAVVEQAAVLAGERHALGDRLVDDVHRLLGEAVDVRLAAAEVAALDRVVEEAEDRVAVALVVLGGVDAALGGDRVRPPGAVVVREDLDVVALLAQRGGGRGAGQAGADDDHVEAAAVVGRHQLHVEACAGSTGPRWCPRGRGR